MRVLVQRIPSTHLLRILIRHTMVARVIPNLAKRSIIPQTLRSIVRKNRYGEDIGDNEKLKYIKEELENFTEDNTEADADEEGTG